MGFFDSRCYVRCRTKNIWKSRELGRAIVDFIGLSEELQSLMYGDNKRFVAEEMALWAIGILRRTGLVDQPRRGVCKATDLRRMLLKKYGKGLNETMRKRALKKLSLIG